MFAATHEQAKAPGYAGAKASTPSHPMSSIVEHLTRLKAFFVQSFAGNPTDMLLQGAAAFVISTGDYLWKQWEATNWMVGVYFMLIVIDTVFGVRVAKKDGKEFRWSRLLYGPGEKAVFGALMIFASQFMERFIPGDFLATATAAYMSAVLFLEAAGKYDRITGHNILGFLRDRVAGLLKSKKNEG